MNILTFNWHEAYISSLSKTGNRFEILERFKGGSRFWFYNTRPVPENAFIVKERDAFDRLSSGYYNIIICHNMKDLSEVKNYHIPKILIFHNKLTTELALGGNKHSKGEYLKSVKEFIRDIKNLYLVFISKTKMDDWGLEGDVITPGIDLSDYNGYRGSVKKVLRVGNFMKRRDIMLGYSFQEKILNSAIPNTLLGINEPSDDGRFDRLTMQRFTESWDDLKECYRSHRVYLNTTVDGFEDGYNLSSLEAMATGMPVVSTANKTSPIIDGYNGYISSDAEYLSKKIMHLFGNLDDAVRLGENARRTIERNFNIKDFVRKWNGVFERVKGHGINGDIAGVKGSRGKVKLTTRHSPLTTKQKNILLAYVSYPVTTARYMERSLRKFHNVITCGPSIGEDIIKMWSLENMKEEIKPHDIPCRNNASSDEILKNLPQGFMPDIFLWIESVYGYFPQGIQKLPFPTACYMIDSHLNLSWHVEWAKQFDFVFVAQKKYIPDFKKVGCRNVFWLPLGCDPDIHRKFDVDKVYDIGFVGSITKNHRRRKTLLDKLSKEFNVHAERSFLKDMALAFSRSRIVFNEAIKDDLNMRVFEALSTGSLLITDEAVGSGLTDFFKDKEHLIIYNDDNIVELTDYYLRHPEEREIIAERGREEVLKKHTYDHRVRQMMDTVFNADCGMWNAELNSELRTPNSELVVEDPLLLQALKEMEDKKYVAALKNLQFALNGRELNISERLKLYLSLGECYVMAGRLDDGIRFYEKAKDIDPQSGSSYIGIGSAYIQDGRYDKAVKEFETAVGLNPDGDNAFYGFGISLYRLGRYEEGKDYLLRYLELHPANIDALYALSSIYHKMGRDADAIDAIEKILIFNPEHSDALELMEKLHSNYEHISKEY